MEEVNSNTDESVKSAMDHGYEENENKYQLHLQWKMKVPESTK